MATQAQTERRTVGWTPKVRLRDGSVGAFIGKCTITGKNRVQTFKNQTYTTWLLNDFGSATDDVRESDKDWVGAA